MNNVKPGKNPIHVESSDDDLVLLSSSESDSDYDDIVDEGFPLLECLCVLIFVISR